MNDLKLKSKTCEFGTLNDSLIIDRVIMGLDSDSLRERLLRTHDLTLDKAVELCRAAEKSRQQSKALAEEVHHAHAIRTVGRKGSQPCEWCSGKHKSPREEHCPAYGATCRKCHKKNHFSRVCKKGKNIDCIEAPGSSSSDDSTDFIDEVDFFLD